MIITYNNSKIRTIEADGVPYVSMRDIMESIVPESWEMYCQVLNARDDLVEDLDIIYIFDEWLIPIYNVSCWIYTITFHKIINEGVRDTVRVFRRDIEKVLSVAWALPVTGLMVSKEDLSFQEISGDIVDFYANQFFQLGMKYDNLSEYLVDYNDLSLLDFISVISSDTYCGSLGRTLCNHIEYIDSLPGSSIIRSYVEYHLDKSPIEHQGYIGDYLTNLTNQIGELTAACTGEL